MSNDTTTTTIDPVEQFKFNKWEPKTFEDGLTQVSTSLFLKRTDFTNSQGIGIVTIVSF
jgi:hypothetical protein